MRASPNCGNCGALKTAQPSGKLRCNLCRNAQYRTAHPLATVEPGVTPETEAIGFVTLLAKAGTQRAASLELGCSQAVVSDRLKKARLLLGDEQTITLLRTFQRDERCGTNLLKPFIINTAQCSCGSTKVANSSGHLVCRSCANARSREYKDRQETLVQVAEGTYQGVTPAERRQRKKSLV